MKRSLAWCAVVAAVLISISACSSDDSSSSGSSNAAGATNTTVSTGSSAASASTSAGGPASSAGAAAASQLDPCSLVTTDQVATFYGGGTVTSSKTGPNVCEFTGPSGQLDVTVYSGKETYDSDASNFSGAAVSGLGDAAFFAKPNALLEFVKGDNVVRIQPNHPLVSDDDVTKLETLAKLAAAQA